MLPHLRKARAARRLCVLVVCLAGSVVPCAGGASSAEGDVGSHSGTASGYEQQIVSMEQLQAGMVAFAQGDFRAAISAFEGVALGGQALQELRCKTALCHLFLGDYDTSRSILQAARLEYAGLLGGVMADAALHQVSSAEQMDTNARSLFFTALRQMQVGDWSGARTVLGDLQTAAADPRTLDIARMSTLSIDATNLFMYQKHEEAYALANRVLDTMGADDLIWKAATQVSRIADKYAYGQTIQDVARKVDLAAQFLVDSRARLSASEAVEIEYHQILGQLGLTKIRCAASMEGGENLAGIERIKGETLDHLSRAYALSRANPDPYFRRALASDLVEIMLLEGQRAPAETLLAELLEEQGNVPVLAEAIYKMGIINLNWGNKGIAGKWFLELLLRFPTSEYCAQVKELYSDLLSEASLVQEEPVPDAGGGATHGTPVHGSDGREDTPPPQAASQTQTTAGDSERVETAAPQPTPPRRITRGFLFPGCLPTVLCVAAAAVVIGAWWFRGRSDVTRER